MNSIPHSSHSVMADQSASGVCWLLLVVLPLTLAQDQCFHFGTEDYTSKNWTDCPVKKLPNALNGTYYIRPEGSEVRVC